MCASCPGESSGSRCGPCAEKAGRANKERKVKRLEAGLCFRCSRAREGSKNFCPKCLLEVRLYNRERGGHVAWKAGSRGRPPMKSA